MKPAQFDAGQIKAFLWFMHCLGAKYNGSMTGGPRSQWRNDHLKELGAGGSNGEPHSKHVWEHGHGCAQDWVFEGTRERSWKDVLEDVEREVEAQGYYYHRAKGYENGQCHVQMMRPGSKAP